MKPFMVSQLQIAFERENLILSPYDEVLYKQLIDYEVEKIGLNGNPTFTNKNEHFVDALGLAYLAMAMEFKELTGVLKDIDVSSKIHISNVNLIHKDSTQRAGEMRTKKVSPEIKEFWENTDFTELRGERQVWVKTNFSSFAQNNYSVSSWGNRDASLGNSFSR